MINFLRSIPVRTFLATAALAAAAVALYLVLSGSGNTGGALPGQPTIPSKTAPGKHVRRPAGHVVNGVVQSPEIRYGNDGYFAQGCNGPSSALHYIVYYPSSRGPHPIVFGMSGSGFEGNSNCDPKLGRAQYQSFDLEMRRWAEAGFVAVNIEYHGYKNGLYGNATYPGAGKWGSAADGIVQLDIKPAVEYFFGHDPAQYGADERQGVIAFGGSSGAHNAYMLSITGVPGHRIWAAAGWSGLPDASLGGSVAEAAFDRYMQAQPGSDIERFGDPAHRLMRTSPPQYIANGTGEFIAAANAERYFQICTELKVPFCYERILDTSGHAAEYENYVFTGASPEITDPKATQGQTVFEDTLAFADRVLHRR